MGDGSVTGTIAVRGRLVLRPGPPFREARGETGVCRSPTMCQALCKVLYIRYPATKHFEDREHMAGRLCAASEA